MAENKTEPKELTVADAAKLVKRQVPVMEGKKPKLDKDGKPVIKDVAVSADEVLDFADHGDHVVVVTKDGKKLRGDK